MELLVRKTNEKIKSIVSIAEKESMSLKSRLDATQRRIDNLVDAVAQGGSAFFSIRNSLETYESEKQSILGEMQKLEKAQDTNIIEITEEAVQDRIQDISKVLANGDPHRIKEELKRNVRGILAFPEAKLRVEIDPEGLLGKEKIEFCPRMVPGGGLEPPWT